MKSYKALEKKIGITFSDPKLIQKAFTHRSYLNENGEGLEHNERLEFLGDAVLQLVVTVYLYEQYPQKPEGELTSWRSALVKGNHLAVVAQKLDLGEYLRLSKGEEATGGREKPYILANTTEAVIGAIYIEKGYDVAKQFIQEFILRKLEEILKKGLHIDAKSHFQEKAQEYLSITPSYKLISDEGPDHDKCFVMGVYLEEELIAQGEGTSKQKAEQAAAKAALEKKGWEK